jgi:hypothetical protein
MTKTFKDLQGLETNDYQNRRGNYPKAGVADSIEVYKGQFGPEVSGSFKNTNQPDAEAWMKRFVEMKGFEVIKVESIQDGDYQNDWVTAFATVAL